MHVNKKNVQTECIETDANNSDALKNKQKQRTVPPANQVDFISKKINFEWKNDQDWHPTKMQKQE